MTEFELRIQAARRRIHERFTDNLERVGDHFGDTEKLSAEISATLLVERRMMILKILGFRDEWGKLTLADNNNIINNYLQGQLKPLVDKWLETHIKPMFEKVAANKMANAEIRKALENKFYRYFDDALRSCLNEAAADLAKQHSKTILAEMTQCLTTMSVNPDTAK